MKLGVTAWDFEDLSAQSLTRQAKFAEGLGFSSFWLPENHFDKRAIPDPLMMLASTASGTTTINLATTSYLLPLRHPLLAAEQVSVLDQLCQGRLILGVGRGYSSAMLQAFDVEPTKKRQIFEEALALMRLAWSGQPISLAEGKAEVILDPLPVQEPHPPIWVAAFGPKALSQAGRLGLPYLASPMETVGKLEDNFRIYSKSVESSGHQVSDIKPLMRLVYVTERVSEIEAIRKKLDDFSTRRPSDLASTDSSEWAIIGGTSEVRDKINEYVGRLSINYLIVSRLRVPGMPKTSVEHSLESLANEFG
tara:strand:+ start:3202 stop:4122 length:921 start_codon:yes stop_codon:yes gene_type:complete